MTVTQVKSVLTNLKYSLDSWIPLSEVGVIFLDQDGRLFPNKSMRLNFGSDGILKIVYGYEDEDGLFHDYKGNTEEAFEVKNYLDFAKIFGFIRSVEYNPPKSLTSKVIK